MHIFFLIYFAPFKISVTLQEISATIIQQHNNIKPHFNIKNKTKATGQDRVASHDIDGLYET